MRSILLLGVFLVGGCSMAAVASESKSRLSVYAFASMFEQTNRYGADDVRANASFVHSSDSASYVEEFDLYLSQLLTTRLPASVCREATVRVVIDISTHGKTRTFAGDGKVMGDLADGCWSLPKDLRSELDPLSK